jgi:hypothetical protein
MKSLKDFVAVETEIEQEYPCDHISNAATRKAMADTDKGKGLVRCKNAKDLFKKLGI